eukprot:CAMPEP_0181332442 /NCGR_PEP_ID=MMETSP1101-20121128/25102_1 /TAXON_ID=46948 /ORGANISM="Rhodomonas abbreviata, Strain Caron Lab Isolate" /LENGTH=72 /DNA_ID=CAMNT_0023442099 /DNA_START=415 /DNA_END=634 /DNA_ORIENTATION=-
MYQKPCANTDTVGGRLSKCACARDPARTPNFQVALATSESRRGCCRQGALPRAVFAEEEGVHSGPSLAHVPD